MNFTPWGLDNVTPIGISIPGTISTGKPSPNVGTVCGDCYAVPKGAGGNFNAALNNGVGPLTPGSAATFSWSSLTAGTNNELAQGLSLGWEDAAQQKNSMVATF